MADRISCLSTESELLQTQLLQVGSFFCQLIMRLRVALGVVSMGPVVALQICITDRPIILGRHHISCLKIDSHSVGVKSC